MLGAGGTQAREAIGEKRARVRDRSRSMGRKLRAITRTIRRRSGEAKREVMKLTGETGELLERSMKEARRLAALAQAARREGVERRRRSKRRASSRSSRIGARRSRGRSGKGWRASRSRTGSCRWSIQTPDRSARGSLVSRTSWVCDAVGGGDREHQAWGEGTDPAGARPSWGTRARTRCCRRTVAELERLGIQRAGGRARRRVQHRADERRARGPGAQDRCSSLAANNPAPIFPCSLDARRRSSPLDRVSGSRSAGLSPASRRALLTTPPRASLEKGVRSGQ